MQVSVVTANSTNIAVISSDELLIADIQSALDLMATIRYEYHCDRIILNKAAICEEFFDLGTRLAGEVLQKFINYQVKFAIVGDFSGYKSKSLRDFIYESNSGTHISFCPTNSRQLKG